MRKLFPASLPLAVAAVAAGLLVLLVIVRMALSSPEPVVQEPAQQVQATTTVPTSTTQQIGDDGTPIPVVATTSSEKAALSARAYAVESLDGSVTTPLSKNRDVQRSLASLTKLMTAVVALQNIAPEETIMAAQVPGGNPSVTHLQIGASYSLSSLMKAMLVSSANEAAESLAAHYGREAFIAAMNAQAAVWGLHDTTFVDPTGLGAGNTSTVNDVLELVRRVSLNYPQVLETTRSASVNVPTIDGTVVATVNATHDLVRHPGFLGGKTGYTDKARGNLVTIVRVSGTDLLVVVLGSEARGQDTRKLIESATPLL